MTNRIYIRGGVAALALAATMTGAGILAAPSQAASTVAPSAITVIDGDTVRMDGQRIRLLGIDAPEISKPRCAAELAQGALARRRLAQLAGTAHDAQLLTNGARDKYNRLLAQLVLDGQDAGKTLLNEGLAVAWHPGRAAWEARARHWCPNWRPTP